MRGRTLFANRIKKQAEPVHLKCSKLHMKISSKPTSIMSQQQFNYEYALFTNGLPIISDVRDNIKYLYQLYSKVCMNGGLVEVISMNKFNIIKQMIGAKFSDVKTYSAENIVQHYIKYEIFSFQISLKTGKRIQSSKLLNLKTSKFIQMSQIGNFASIFTKSRTIYDQNIINIKNFCPFVNLAESDFSISQMKQRYANQCIFLVMQNILEKQQNQFQLIKNKDLICQNKQNCETLQTYPYLKSCISQQNLNQFKKSNIAQQVKFHQYCAYYESYPQETYQQRNKFQKNKKQGDFLIQKVAYAFGLDPKDDFHICQINQKISKVLFSYREKSNLLSYCDQDIPGVTLPNFEFHVQGTWSGATQQPLGMSKVDVNFGPDPVQWYCISHTEINKLYSVFASRYNLKVQQITSKWFQDIDWFIQNQIQVTKIVQLKGDAIFIGISSMTWFKSVGKSIHASWLLMPKNEKQIQSMAFHSLRLKEHNYQSVLMKNKKIPFKTILLRALNHDQKKQNSELDKELSMSSIKMIRQMLKKWYIQQQKQLNFLTVRQDILSCQFKICPLFDSESYCVSCQNQILNYFINNNGINCLQCISKSFQSKKLRRLKDSTIYTRYQQFWIYYLLFHGFCRKIMDSQTYLAQIQAVCKGEHLIKFQQCSKSQFMSQQKLYVQQQSDKWKQTISSYFQQEKNVLQSFNLFKIQSLLHKRTKNKVQNRDINEEKDKHCHFYNNYAIQTDLGLMVETQQLVKTENKCNFIYKKPNFHNKNKKINQQLNKISNQRKMKRRQKQSSVQDGQTNCDRQSNESFQISRNQKQQTYQKQKYPKNSYQLHRDPDTQYNDFRNKTNTYQRNEPDLPRYQQNKHFKHINQDRYSNKINYYNSRNIKNQRNQYEKGKKNYRYQYDR